MKKKKTPKKEDMTEFAFKEFTPEEDRIYTEAVTKFREAVGAGKTLKQAYETYTVSDKELEKIIQADFLKIMIAERHFSGKDPLDKIAKDLGIPAELVQDTYGRMLQEVGVTAANQFAETARPVDADELKTND